MHKTPISSPPTHAPNKARATAQPKALARDQRQCSRISRRRRRRPLSSCCRVRALPLPAQSSLLLPPALAPCCPSSRGEGSRALGGWSSVRYCTSECGGSSSWISILSLFDSIRFPRVAGVGGILQSFTGVSGIHKSVCRLASRRSGNRIEEGGGGGGGVYIKVCRIVVVGCAVVSWWDSFAWGGIRELVGRIVRDSLTDPIPTSPKSIVA